MLTSTRVIVIALETVGVPGDHACLHLAAAVEVVPVAINLARPFGRIAIGTKIVAMALLRKPAILQISTTGRLEAIPLTIVVQTTRTLDDAAIDGFDDSLGIRLTKLFEKCLVFHFRSIGRVGDKGVFNYYAGNALLPRLTNNRVIISNTAVRVLSAIFRV